MTKFTVYHSYYGCDSGCCGHVVESDDDKLRSKFSFVHPYGNDHYRFAQDLLRHQFGDEHVADLDWDNCLILED